MEAGRDWDDGDGDEASAETPEAWLRPVWEDDDADLDAPPLRQPLTTPALPRRAAGLAYPPRLRRGRRLARQPYSERSGDEASATCNRVTCLPVG